MDIIVLAGGYSTERDVSLASGSKVAEALKSRGHKVVLLDSYESIEACGSFEELYGKYAKDKYDFVIPQVEPDLKALKEASGNGENMLGKNVLEACKLADVVFLGLHGSIGENGQLQAAFDLFDICYTGSSYIGCLLSMDKNLSKEIMNTYGIKTASGEEILVDQKTEDELFEILSAKKLPFVVKPCSGGSSIGVYIVKEPGDIKTAVKGVKNFDGKILVEEYISGREFTVGVIDNEAMPVIEICPKSGFFDYANKYQEGCTDEICPAQIPQELAERLKSAAVKAHKALRLGDYSRADFIVDKNGEIYCLEVNSLPGLTPSSLVPKEAKAVGMEYSELCEKIVKLALKRKG